MVQGEVTRKFMEHGEHLLEVEVWDENQLCFQKKAQPSGRKESPGQKEDIMLYQTIEPEGSVKLALQQGGIGCPGWGGQAALVSLIVALALLRLGVVPLWAAPFAYITNDLSNTVSVIDTATQTVVATVRGANNPDGVAVHPAGTLAYVANRGDGRLFVIDTATNTVITSVGVGSHPEGVAVHPVGTFVYVANSDGTVSIIDTAVHSVVATVPIPGLPTYVAVHPSGRWVYVTSAFTNTVSVIDTAVNNVVATVWAGQGPIGVAVHPAGTCIYVANLTSGTVSVIDTDTLQVIATIPAGRAPVGVAVHPAGTRMYVTNSGVNGNTVAIIDTAINAVVATVPVGLYPSGIAVHPAGTLVYVANHNSSTVSVIDTATNTVITPVWVGDGPRAVGQFIGPVLPGLSFSLNQANFWQGQTLTLAAKVYPGETSRRRDVYVAIQLPDETLFFLQADGNFTREIRPIVNDWALAPFSGEIFRYSFGGAELSGRYTWLAAFTEPGTLNIIGLIAQASFSFNP